MQTAVFSAPDIECGGCAATIERALSRLPGVVSVKVDVEARQVIVEHEDGTNPPVILSRLDEVGFPSQEIAG